MIKKIISSKFCRSFKKGAIGGASVEVEGAGMEDTAGRGLIAGHAYTLRRELKN